jgi:hypothetical protein
VTHRRYTLLPAHVASHCSRSVAVVTVGFFSGDSCARLRGRRTGQRVIGYRRAGAEQKCNQQNQNACRCDSFNHRPENYVRVISDATGRREWRSQIARTAHPTVDVIQKCPELIPASPPGAYDGRPKCAAVDVWCSPVSSLTTPSSGDEAQAESSHATASTRIPHQTACLFTEPNLLIAERDATSGIPALMLKRRRREKILRGKKSSRLVLHGRQLGRA